MSGVLSPEESARLAAATALLEAQAKYPQRKKLPRLARTHRAARRNEARRLKILWREIPFLQDPHSGAAVKKVA